MAIAIVARIDRPGTSGTICVRLGVAWWIGI